MKANEESRKKGMSNKNSKRRFILVVAFLTTILGCANIMDRLGLLPKIMRMPSNVGQTNSVVRAAEPAKAQEILTSVVNAAEIFSIRAGGGGDSLFPTNAVQMRDNMPPVVARSLEGCFSASVVPLGGYVCRYQADPARTNFLCKAIPANGYTGCVFVVRKDKTIRQVDDKVSNFTKSESRK